jgi:hypothetical protein
MKLLSWESVLLWGLAVVLAWAGSSMAAERLTIGHLHKYNASYQMHSVTLVGKVESMHAHPPKTVRSKPCRTLYGVAEFVLVDDTGSLPVETLGSCFPAAMGLPRDGDLVELTARIHVFVPDGQTAQVIKAFTQEIVILTSKATVESPEK